MPPDFGEIPGNLIVLVPVRDKFQVKKFLHHEPPRSEHVKITSVTYTKDSCRGYIAEELLLFLTVNVVGIVIVTHGKEEKFMTVKEAENHHLTTNVGNLISPSPGRKLNV